VKLGRLVAGQFGSCAVNKLYRQVARPSASITDIAVLSIQVKVVESPLWHKVVTAFCRSGFFQRLTTASSCSQFRTCDGRFEPPKLARFFPSKLLSVIQCVLSDVVVVSTEGHFMSHHATTSRPSTAGCCIRHIFLIYSYLSCMRLTCIFGCS